MYMHITEDISLTKKLLMTLSKNIMIIKDIIASGDYEIIPGVRLQNILVCGTEKDYILSLNYTIDKLIIKSLDWQFTQTENLEIKDVTVCGLINGLSEEENLIPIEDKEILTLFKTLINVYREYEKLRSISRLNKFLDTSMLLSV